MKTRVLLLLAVLALATVGGALGNLDATCAYEDSKKYGKTSSGMNKGGWAARPAGSTRPRAMHGPYPSGWITCFTPIHKGAAACN